MSRDQAKREMANACAAGLLASPPVYDGNAGNTYDNLQALAVVLLRKITDDGKKLEGEDVYSVITDSLTDVMHLCCSLDIDFDLAIETAARQAEEELFDAAAYAREPRES